MAGGCFADQFLAWEPDWNPSSTCETAMSISIKNALFIIFAIVALIVAGQSLESIHVLDKVNQASTDIADDWLPSVVAAKSIEAEIASVRIAYFTHITSLTDETMTKAEAGLAEEKARLAGSLANYRQKFTDQIEEVAILDQIDAALARYYQLGDKLLALSRKNENEAATAMLQSMQVEVGPVVDNIQKLVQFNEKGASARSADGDQLYASTKFLTLVVAGIAGILVLASLAYVILRIIRPLNRMVASMNTLAMGDAESAIPFTGRRDEVGTIAVAVEVFRQAAIEKRVIEQQAADDRRHAEEERERIAAEAEANAQARLAQATSGLATALHRLALGDLTFQITDAFAPDFEELRHNLNRAVEQLGTTLAVIAQSANQIDSGSREISIGANDLSKRTEQQAASLEETAAALDEITANVASSTKRTEEARSTAVQTSESAIASGRVVERAVHAMQGIERTSSQISNIIGVIDEIAFQTNLLALNAGVEAARAGEAGKGFAVVAQEVRELAQRSAVAAKEIKDLIRASENEVKGGVELVSETGKSLETIRGFIDSINQHMASIALSAREQSVGLSEVNTAVNDMDQVTQKNAAMVEETNAASASLAIEAGKLRELLSQFSLPGVVAGKAAPVREVRQDKDRSAGNVRALQGMVQKLAVGGNRGWEDF